MAHWNGRAAPALVLFDIDGTLLRRAGPHHREALVEAVRNVTGLEATTDNIPVQGMLDPDILAWMLRDQGAGEAKIRQWMPRLIARAQWVYARRCPADLRDKVCPGVPELLEALHRFGAATGLVSGNLTRIGWKKVERAGLKRFFRFGAFSDRGGTRAGLVRSAVSQARREGWIDAGAPVSLIGDHPNDVTAAQANRVRAVAVATGLSPAEDLAGCHPDLLVEDLRALDVEYFFS
ncbi:MAG: HAD family hydrolase [Acidobacteria bacterium]|nr:HAD family hydrolase [Acidobacteriota bacterium]